VVILARAPTENGGEVSEGGVEMEEVVDVK
jgi:hypothetical protein